MNARARRLPTGDTVVFEDEDESPLVEIVAGLTIGTLLLVGFALLFSGYPYFWVVWAAGFAGLLPAAVGAAKYYENRLDDHPAKADNRDDADVVDDDTDSALRILRERYARGEIDEETFERRVELLLDTESVADAERRLAAVRRRRVAETESEYEN